MKIKIVGQFIGEKGVNLRKVHPGWLFDTMMDMNPRHKVLIVEDDEAIAHAIARKLENWNMETLIADDFYHIDKVFADSGCSLVLMDIRLPHFDGYHWTRMIRKLSKVPILFLSSAADNMNIIMAMNMGADDFIAKPFDLDVLLAKIQALLRRSYDYHTDQTLLAFDDLFLSLSDQTLHYGSESMDLSKNEFGILHTLFEHPDSIVSRQKLMERLWKTDQYVDENTLSVNVNRLRKKLEKAGICDLIETCIGQGYRLKRRG